MIRIKAREKTNCFLKGLSDTVNHIGKGRGARGLLSTTANGPTLALRYIMQGLHDDAGTHT
jgi:hypothetical protein